MHSKDPPCGSEDQIPAHLAEGAGERSLSRVTSPTIKFVTDRFYPLLSNKSPGLGRSSGTIERELER